MPDLEYEPTLLVEFRSTADPPTVVISTDHEEALLALRQAFEVLAQVAPPFTASLSELEGVRLVDLDALLLVRVPDSKRLRVEIEMTGRPGGACVTWYGREDDWLSRAGLVEGVGAFGQPGFQWLTTEYRSRAPVDVVVSFRSGGQY
jgi:hypothetical protein